MRAQPNARRTRPELRAKIDMALFLEMAGKATDAATARALGCSDTTVKKYREELGIPAARRYTRPESGWRRAEYDPRLPESADAEFARLLSASGLGGYTDDPRAPKATGLGPRPIPMRSPEYSGCGNAAIMCLA